MLIRKNTKTFKSILEIITACQERKDRDKLIRLYITRAGHTIADRISVEGIQGDAALFYEMNYQTVLNNLGSSNHQLHSSDDVPGIYFFHSGSNKVWDEAPFEFDEAVKKEFNTVAELPITRKKEKIEKFSLPSAHTKSDKTKSEKTKRVSVTAEEKQPEKKKGVEQSPLKVTKGPKQPDYNLKHEIFFTDLSRVVYRAANVTKHNVLDYYNTVADYILPYLKDRPLHLYRQSEIGRRSIANLGQLLQNNAEEIPDWLKTSKVNMDKSPLICNDKEHLLYYVEQGIVEFDAEHVRLKQPGAADYILITVDSPQFEIKKAIEVLLLAKEILDGLRLPSFVKLDGRSAVHVYIPLDSKTDVKTSNAIAEYMCKLIRLKIPGLVYVRGSEDNVYGKVSLNFFAEEHSSAVVPYSLIVGSVPSVAAPLHWDDVTIELHPEEFNYETIFKRLKKNGDPFESIGKKKVSGLELLQRLEQDYSFLF